MPMDLTQCQLADGIQVPYQRINDLINGKRGVTPSTALRLGKYFGNTAGFWMNLQLRWASYRAQQVEARQLTNIEPLIPLKPREKSHLDMQGIDLGISTQEILGSVAENRDPYE